MAKESNDQHPCIKSLVKHERELTTVYILKVNLDDFHIHSFCSDWVLALHLSFLRARREHGSDKESNQGNRIFVPISSLGQIVLDFSFTTRSTRI